MQLSQLLANLDLAPKKGSDPIITHLTLDSRQAQPGSLFFAISGSDADGHDYIDDAISRGAVAIVLERLPSDPKPDITYIKVDSTRVYVGPIAAQFYDHPSGSLQLVGVTGTNGKTTVVHLLKQLLTHLGAKVGSIGTLGSFIANKPIPTSDQAPTSPGAIEFQASLAHMRDAGCSHVLVEVTSHALDQGRVDGTHFNGAIFTNITLDHIDYHRTFENYLAAKRRLFNMLDPDAWALANFDDPNGQFMLQNTNATTYGYGLGTGNDYDADLQSNDVTGLSLGINDSEPARTNLVGTYNAYNLTAVYGAAELLGFTPVEIMRALPLLTPPPGRFEILRGHGDRIGIVDYAHTPDAVEQTLQSIRDISPAERRLITVVGAGGDRDRGKRPLMAQVAYRLSDYVIFTSDNPRTEPPMQIINDMLEGIRPYDEAKIAIIPDRRAAIAISDNTSGPGDIIAVLGKGHETYQEIDGTKHDFDDVVELQKVMQQQPSNDR